ncbi:MAG: hypothetical protein L0Z50_27025 [Verrucomicrobiales bacterium]|nr:hypothetical protein [Verrucomicrobiales bacterium]
MNDLKFAFRQLVECRGFTTLTVLTLALGIGANTAVFSFVDHLLIFRYEPVTMKTTLARRLTSAAANL